MTLANKIVVPRAGVIEQIGSPLELYNNPANTFVAGFIGSPRMNLLEASVVMAEGGKVQLALTGDSNLAAHCEEALKAGQKVTVGIRPEALSISASGTIMGTIAVIEHLGSEALCYVDIGGGTLVTVKMPPSAKVGIGQKVKLAAAAEDALLFDEQGISFRHTAM